MKNHFKLIYLVIFTFLLSGCYPCGFLDWNCNHVAETSWYKASEKCDNEQTGIAEERLKGKFNREVYDHIVNQCIYNSNYKFESDPRYVNYQ